MSFIGRLLASNDKTADSVVFGGLIALAAMICISGYSVVRNHKDFNELTFGGGAMAIIGGIGGGKAVRDRFSPSGSPPTLPETASEANQNAGT
jgi:hypothetical protein